MNLTPVLRCEARYALTVFALPTQVRIFALQFGVTSEGKATGISRMNKMAANSTAKGTLGSSGNDH
jgi:hypothetical protein